MKRKAGNSPDSFTYFADSDETGHADIFTAKALSDLVCQELAEYGGLVAGMRIAPPESAGLEPSHRMSLRPDHSEDFLVGRPSDALAVVAGSGTEGL